MDQYVRRIIGFAVKAGNVDGFTLCCLFNDATSEQGWPERISTDYDPIFQYHRWKATLRILEIEEIKSLPYVPMSHPFVERLIGSIRRKLLDQTFFWTASDRYAGVLRRISNRLLIPLRRSAPRRSLCKPLAVTVGRPHRKVRFPESSSFSTSA